MEARSSMGAQRTPAGSVWKSFDVGMSRHFYGNAILSGTNVSVERGYRIETLHLLLFQSVFSDSSHNFRICLISEVHN